MSMRGTSPTVIKTAKDMTRNEAIHEAEREKEITFHQVVIQSRTNHQKEERKVVVVQAKRECIENLLVQVQV